MITLRQLEFIAEVVRCEGSVTQAAARLYVSQPGSPLLMGTDRCHPLRTLTETGDASYPTSDLDAVRRARDGVVPYSSVFSARQ